MLEEDGATQALADVTPAPSEDDVESSYEETKSRKVKKEDPSKAMKNAFPRKLRRTWPSACHGDSEDNEGKGKHRTCSTKWRKPKRSRRPRSAQTTGEGGGQEKAIECTEQAPGKTERGTCESTAPAFP